MSVTDAENRFSLIERDPDQALLVGCAGSEVIGLLAFQLRHNLESVSHYGEIATIVIDSAYRGRGVGGILIDAAEELAAQRECVGLWLVSGFGREEEAHRFYERRGFEKTGFRFVKIARNAAVANDPTLLLRGCVPRARSRARSHPTACAPSLLLLRGRSSSRASPL